MPKSKSKRYYRNTRPAVNTPAPVNAAGSINTPAPVRASTQPKSAVMFTSTTVGSELKVIGILSVLILGAIVVLSIVLR